MAKREYIAAVARRYRAARSRQQKGQILDEVCATCGCRRKAAIRLLRSPGRSKRVQKRRGRPALYAWPTLFAAAETIWKEADFPCSTRLKAMLPLWINGYERRYNGLDSDVRKALLEASASSLKRLLEPVRRKYTLRGRATTKPGTMLRNTIPIATGQWEQTKPGFIEADTVAHCGGSMAGQFAYTLDCVDLATGWTEQRAVWAKRDSDVVAQMRLIERALPFPMLGFDSDNGSEFMNQKMLAFLIDRQKPVQFTRSRAYCKNDNAHIEQKNWTHVRQMIGYERFDDPTVIADLNNLYGNEWRLYHNFFGASVKLIAKKRVGSKTVKTYDVPQTPYQRVLASEHVSDYAKEGLRRVFEKLDPFVLKDAMNAKIKALFR